MGVGQPKDGTYSTGSPKKPQELKREVRPSEIEITEGRRCERENGGCKNEGREGVELGMLYDDAAPFAVPRTFGSRT